MLELFATVLRLAVAALTAATSMTLIPTAAPPAASASETEREAERLETADWVPIRGRIRISRTWGHRGAHDYPAIDFEVPAGRSVPIYSAGPGTVIQTHNGCSDTIPSGAHTECNEGKGNFVEITHADGRRSRYLHLRQGSVTVEVGQHVCRGCLIGRSGWSGNVSPPGPAGGHLHYEEVESFSPVDPGIMLARHGSDRVSYPGKRSWTRAGAKRVTIRNTGFPRRDPDPIVECMGWAATRVGTSGSDEMLGTAGPDIIAGGDGNDSINGLDADDRLCGGGGDDSLVGGVGLDSIDGGDGTDTCFQDYDDGTPQTSGELIACEGGPYQLTVSVGGECCLRLVTSEPAGITCPPDCSEVYPPNQRVILRLNSGSGYWSGCEPYKETRHAPDCTVVMDQPRLVGVR